MSAIAALEIRELNKYLKQLFEGEFLDKVYPVGAIYMATNNVSPANFLGGTWERIQDRFLLAAGSKYSNGSLGGSATITLESSQLPKHDHTVLSRLKSSNVYYDIPDAEGTGNAIILNGTTHYGDIKLPEDKSGELTATDDFGSPVRGEPIDKMPPYLAVYVWKRIA